MERFALHATVPAEDKAYLMLAISSHPAAHSARQNDFLVKTCQAAHLAALLLRDYNNNKTEIYLLTQATV